MNFPLIYKKITQHNRFYNVVTDNDGKEEDPRRRLFLRQANGNYLQLGSIAEAR
jgi:hypothetical protein